MAIIAPVVIAANLGLVHDLGSEVFFLALEPIAVLCLGLGVLGIHRAYTRKGL